MKIVTDSAADLPADELRTLGIQVAPLKFHFPDGELSTDQISPDQFYTRLREMEPDIPKTSQPSSSEFSRLYMNMIPDDEEILSIHISSGLSGTVGEIVKRNTKCCQDRNLAHFPSIGCAYRPGDFWRCGRP
jgi:DegV family protein with EDD domain